MCSKPILPTLLRGVGLWFSINLLGALIFIDSTEKLLIVIGILVAITLVILLPFILAHIDPDSFGD